MTENEIELMRALTAMQAALWDVVDEEYHARRTLRTIAKEVTTLTRAVLDWRKNDSMD